jgi:acetyltransferase-like isoleucine patch superfamily enzyme
MQAPDSMSRRQGYIGPGAFVPASARVYEGAWIGDGVELGAGVIVGPGAVVGFDDQEGSAPLTRIGENVSIGPGVHLQRGVEIGAGSRLEAGSFLGAGTRIGPGTRVGPNCTIMGHCQIQEYVLLYADVHVCEYAVLHPHCQLMPGVKLLNDPCPPTRLDVEGPRIGKCAVVGVNAIIWSGVRVGDYAVVASASVVKHDVADYLLVRGTPARVICDTRRIQMRLKDRWVYPYPWVRHLMDGEDISKPASAPDARRPR